MTGTDGRADLDDQDGTPSDVDALVARCLDRIEQGASVSTAVEELCGGQPDTASTVRHRLELLADVGVLSSDHEPVAPDRLGPFRLLRKLGGGGMGLVYLARQDGLERHVALKIVRPAQLHFEGARERFRREVETVARLQHPGVVPIYEVGETDDTPWFTMEHVRGATLEQVLVKLRGRDPAELTGRDLALTIARCTDLDAEATRDDEGWVFAGSWEEACLRVTHQVAEALDHVHRRGIVHRDVKPSNVMLTTSGRAMLLDFGLASAEGSASITATGAPVGSLPYMSPEQTRGASTDCGPSTDVYSLGVTLFELLTLTPAFSRSSAAALVSAIQEGRRTAPRSVHRRLSRDAETVCLTAMAADPARRYAGAGDLSRDLRNVLERRPIEARRTGVALRALLWTRRHPAAALALALAVVLFVGGPVFVAVQEHRHGEQMTVERQAALTGMRQAIEAVNRMSRMIESELAFSGVPEAARRRIIEEAVALVDKLLESGANQPLVRIEAARLQTRIAELERKLGDAEAGLAACGTALALVEGLEGEAGSEGPILARIHSSRASCLANLGREEEAGESLALALDARRAWMEEHGATFETLVEQSTDWISVGVHRRRTSLEQAEAACRQGMSLAEQALVVPGGRSEGEARAAAGHAANALAVVLWRAGRLEEAEPLAQQAIDYLEAVVDFGLGRFDNRRVLASAHYNHAMVLTDLARHDEAIHGYERARSEQAALARDVPDRTDFSYSLAQTCNALGNALFRLDRLDEASDVHAEGRAALRELLVAHPEDPRFRHELATLYTNAASIARLSRPDEPQVGIPHADEALGLLAPLLSAAPQIPEFRSLEGQALSNRGWARAKTGEPDAGRADLERGIDRLRSALADQPGHPNFRAALSESLGLLAEVCRDAGDHLGAAHAEDELSGLE
jgi:hypothetical protein